MPDSPLKFAHVPPPSLNPNEIADAQKNTEIVHLYFNGFSIGLSSADVAVLLKENNIPRVICNISLTTAKTLAKQLNALIINFEGSANREIMTTDIVDQALNKMRNVKP